MFVDRKDNNIKMSTPPKATHDSAQFLSRYHWRISQNQNKYSKTSHGTAGEYKQPQPSRERSKWRNPAPWYQTAQQGHCNQNSLVLTQEQTQTGGENRAQNEPCLHGQFICVCVSNKNVIDIKLTYHRINHFKMSTLVVFNTVTELCTITSNSRTSSSPRKETPYSLAVTSPSPSPLPPCTPCHDRSACSGHVLQMEQHSARCFLSGFRHSAQCFLGSSVSERESALRSFTAE